MLQLKNISIVTPLFCAPMAEITHSAFRRLLADFGGYGALYTEMLSGRAILQESADSPYVRRRPREGVVFYQLLVNGTEPLEEIVARLTAFGADGLDLNAACPSPSIRALRAGAFLFEDETRLATTLQRLRACFQGPLTVKIRLGKNSPDWQAQLVRRLKIIEDSGVDAIILHPRFQGEKLKRAARHALFPWAASQTKLPLIANGDIPSGAYVRTHPQHFAGVAGIMLGRMAAAQPWIFAQWQESTSVDYARTWQTLFDYVCEDFDERKALFRLKIFTAYYARNFVYGHTLFKAAQNAKSLTELHSATVRFLTSNPAVNQAPSVSGL